MVYVIKGRFYMNWILRFVVFIFASLGIIIGAYMVFLFLVWFLVGDGMERKSFLHEILKKINLSTDISQYECSDVVDLVKGEELQNAFGGKFKILFIEDVKLISKNNNKIICSGKLKLSNGSDQIMKLSVTKNSDSEIYYEVSP